VGSSRRSQRTHHRATVSIRRSSARL
jgi:hypothetical protein